MEWQSLAPARTHDDPLRAQIGRLIEVVGTPRFESEMFRTVRAATRCEHLTAFAVSEGGAPRTILASNTGSMPIARSLAERYVTRYWNLDPASQVGRRRAAQDMMLRIVSHEIEDSAYRHDCYTAVNLRDRVTVIRHHGGDVYRFNVYRAVDSGRFGGAQIDRIVNAVDLLTALLVKHDVLAAAPDRAATVQFQDRLRLVEPTMPTREIEVCAGIMRGMTSEAIALTLGVSINTVLTYRKRAYARLGISCQNELLRLVLS